MSHVEMDLDNAYEEHPSIDELLAWCHGLPVEGPLDVVSIEVRRTDRLAALTAMLDVFPESLVKLAGVPVTLNDGLDPSTVRLHHRDGSVADLAGPVIL